MFQMEESFWKEDKLDNVLDKFSSRHAFPNFQKKDRVLSNSSFPGNVIYQQFNLNFNPYNMPAAQSSSSNAIAAILSQLTSLTATEPFKAIPEEKKFEELPELIDLTDLDDIVAKDLGKLMISFL